MKFIAHRGESLEAPENTLESFSLAWKLGAVGIEGDFHQLKDGSIVCMHDANTLRTTGVEAELSELDISAVKNMDAGSWKGPHWRGAIVPTLIEVLETIPEQGVIYIEIKDKSPEMISQIKEQADNIGLRPEQVVIISFTDEVIAAAKKVMPEAKAYLLTGLNYTENRFEPEASELIARMRQINADGIDCQANIALDREFVRTIQDAGYEFHVWTVDDISRAESLIKLGVDSITTNCANVMNNALGCIYD